MKMPVPYDFIFDYLPRNVIVKPRFGMHYVYLDKKIIIILRKVLKNMSLNGIWVATSKEHHRSLEEDIPAMTNFVMDNGEMHDFDWRLLQEDDNDFEMAAIRLCELIARHDKRIGKETKGGAML